MGSPATANRLLSMVDFRDDTRLGSRRPNIRSCRRDDAVVRPQAVSFTGRIVDPDRYRCRSIRCCRCRGVRGAQSAEAGYFTFFGAINGAVSGVITGFGVGILLRRAGKGLGPSKQESSAQRREAQLPTL